eukprot:14700534-Alexandrium_andersonii.AAC.1
MLRPLFSQQYSPRPGGGLGRMLTLALRWWARVLRMRLARVVPTEPVRDTVHLFCDAAGHPSRIAAVLLDAGEWSFTDAEPPGAVRDAFITRADEQIMGLELLAIVLGLCSFM